MCNLYRLHKGPDAIRALFDELKLPLDFPEGVPNLEPRDVRITEMAPIVRQAESGRYELLMRRWSWPGTHGKPLYNFRSEGRNFPANRCIVLADGFYEYTAPGDPKQKRKDRWLFTPADGGLIGIAGFTRETPGVGEAFTLLTAGPGPDVAPFHGRQIVLIPRTSWRPWMDHSEPSSNLLVPTGSGFLSVQPATLP